LHKTVSEHNRYAETEWYVPSLPSATTSGSYEENDYSATGEAEVGNIAVGGQPAKI
jgi:hypothetical protein